MASTAIGMLGYRRVWLGLGRAILIQGPERSSEGFLALDHLVAAVLPAVGAGAMRHLDLPAVGAGGGGRAGQRVVGAALVAAGLGMAAFRVRHGRRASLSLGSWSRGPGIAPG